VSRQLTGAAGEFFVAAELARRGWAPSVTPKGVERTDVLAQHLETKRVVALQVKATTTGTAFTLGEKDETVSEAENEWYVLVGLTASNDLPTYYVLPRNHVATLIYVHHRVWLTQSARNGQPHRDNPRRAINSRNLAEGEGAWDRLQHATTAVPLRVTPFYRELLKERERVGIPLPAPGLQIEDA
jgi:hypothetical protein